MNQLFNIPFFIDLVVTIYAAIACFSYLMLGIIAARELQMYQKKSKTGNQEIILSSPFAPTVTVLAPAFNESLSIVDNIKGLLALKYHKLEIVVVNDGSKDDTLEKVIHEFELEKVFYPFDYEIGCKQIRGIYKSRNMALDKLLVVYRAAFLKLEKHFLNE
jgi:biofilm PGA synthesis N-glycosyltransferase PgaC